MDSVCLVQIDVSDVVEVLAPSAIQDTILAVQDHVYPIVYFLAIPAKTTILPPV